MTRSCGISSAARPRSRNRLARRASLIETAARNHLLQARGLHSARGFAERLDDEISLRRQRRIGGSER